MAYNREDYYILLYGRKGIEPHGILTNKILGGGPPKPVWDEKRKQKHSEWNKRFWTEERKAKHREEGRHGDGGVGTVCVTTLYGDTIRIDKTIYDNMDRNKPLSEWEYISVSSKEAKRRRLIKHT